jgi:hypothetical protein
MFKYRVTNKENLTYFYQYAELILIVEPFRSKGVKFGIISLVKKNNVPIHNIASILRKELKIDEK